MCACVLGRGVGWGRRWIDGYNGKMKSWSFGHGRGELLLVSLQAETCWLNAIATPCANLMGPCSIQVVDLDDQQTRDECHNGFLWQKIKLGMKQASGTPQERGSG